MRSDKTLAVWIAAVVSLVFCFYLFADPAWQVSYPRDFREWVHVKSAVVGPQSPAFATEAGIHHIYANKKAMEGYRSGKFPEHSVIVYHLLETKEVSGTTIEGPTRRVDVMVKDTKRFGDTGGWGYESYRGSDRTQGVSAEVKAICSSCRAKVKQQDSVFSRFRE